MASVSSVKKYLVNDDRHYDNPYKDISDAYSKDPTKSGEYTGENQVGEYTMERLSSTMHNLLDKFEEHEHSWFERDDNSIYTGSAGVAQMYYLVGKSQGQQSYIKKAQELIDKSLLKEKRNRDVAYLTGNPGPLALGAVIHHTSGNNAKSAEMVLRLKSLAKKALSEPSCELLYGKVGYLFSLLFVNTNISPRPVEAELIKQIIEIILEEGREYARYRKYDTPIMYKWHDSEYLGGAHGLAGILYILIQAREYLTEEQLHEVVKPALRYLQRLQYPSGNFPSSIGSRSDRLVHWCHGAPSVTMLFISAHKVFGEQSFLQTAIECGEVVWARGLLKKGYSLCHGVSGNAYTFLALYQYTNENKHLYRACKFAEWCETWGKHAERPPDRPFSLFEGLAGTIHLFADMFNPKSAKFPGYTLINEIC